MAEEKKEKKENPNVATLKYWAKPETGFGAHLARTRDGPEKAGKLESLAIHGSSDSRFTQTQEVIRQQMVAKGASYEEAMASVTPFQVYREIQTSIQQAIAGLSLAEVYGVFNDVGIKLNEKLDKDFGKIKLSDLLEKKSKKEKLDEKESAALELGSVMMSTYFSSVTNRAYQVSDSSQVDSAIHAINEKFYKPKEAKTA